MLDLAWKNIAPSVIALAFWGWCAGLTAAWMGIFFGCPAAFWAGCRPGYPGCRLPFMLYAVLKDTTFLGRTHVSLLYAILIKRFFVCFPCHLGSMLVWFSEGPSNHQEYDFSTHSLQGVSLSKKNTTCILCFAWCHHLPLQENLHSSFFMPRNQEHLAFFSANVSFVSWFFHLHP